jgi:hypothetical protein
MNRHRVKAAFVGGLLVAFAASPAWAERWANSLFAEQAHDFGPVPRGAKVHHPFVLTNRLNEAVTILDVRASCGCTTGRANASIVPPGRSAIVEAEMDTRNFVDRKETTLFVSLVTASGREAEVRLGVASTILSDLVLNPGSIDFGSVAKGETPRLTLTIDRVGSPNWRVEKMVSASKVINAALVETARNEAQVSYTLNVSLKPDAPAGIVRDEIRILTNDRETPSIPIPFTAQIRGELTASPSAMNLGNVTSAGASQARFYVKGAKPFTIKSVDGDGDGFKLVEPDPSKKVLHALMVVYKPEEGTTRGDLHKALRIHTDLPGEPPVEVQVMLHIDP